MDLSRGAVEEGQLLAESTLADLDSDLDPEGGSTRSFGATTFSAGATKLWRAGLGIAAVLLLLGVGLFWGFSEGGAWSSPAGRTAATRSSVDLHTVYLPPKARLDANELKQKAVDGTVHDYKLNWTQRLELQSLTGWPPAPLEHKNEDCWESCQSIAGDCKWCGTGNACCRDGAAFDPPECHSVAFTTSKFHTCVSPVKPNAIKHYGQECFFACGGKTGYCDWCGHGNACCQQGYAGVDAPECYGAVDFGITGAHTCVATTGACKPGQVQDESGQCVMPPEADLLTIYMYRAESDKTYPINEGVNMASLGGVMWYLHNEVVTDCPRKYDITRIKRYKVTMKASAALYTLTKRNFDSFVPFKKAKCTEADCDQQHWIKYGYTPGCTYLGADVAAYPEAIWYSLPGPCPSEPFTTKDQRCRLLEPGGFCESPTGASNCTWHSEEAGEISLTDLQGFLDYKQFCALGNVEYDTVTDRGKGINFWDGKLDAGKCNFRVRQVRDAFGAKYPNMPQSLGVPVCDAQPSAPY